jgi:hypothetical protein
MHPGTIVPGIPEKQAIGRFQEEFIEGRRLGLQFFLRKISAHPLLRSSPDFRMFLESDSLKAEVTSTLTLAHLYPCTNDYFIRQRMTMNCCCLQNQKLSSLILFVLESFVTIDILNV